MKRLFICCISSAVFGGLLASWLVQAESCWFPESVAQAQAVTAPADATLFTSVSTQPPTSLTSEELTNIHVYEGANRGVVNVTTEFVTHGNIFLIPVPGEGAGSGSVLDKRGHILTNNHVIEDARTISVALPNGKSYKAEIVGKDMEQDIAVLKIDAPAEELFPIPLGTSDGLRVGQRVYTLGNPFGLEGTLTTGIISNLNRTLPSKSGIEMKSIIQTDAAMNPGNSGGPLLDTSGRMVGMNVAIATKTGQSAGLGFAIPANRIRQVVQDLIQHGKVVRADIGIVVVKELDNGLQIMQTNQGGPAEKAGLRGYRAVKREVKRGPLVYNVETVDPSHADIIVAVDGQPVGTASAFVDKIQEHRPQDKIVLTIVRAGQRMDVPVTLGGA